MRSTASSTTPERAGPSGETPGWIVPLSGEAARDPALTGGKASSLATLWDLDAGIPDGFVVTTRAYRDGRRADRLTARLQAAVAAAYAKLGQPAVAARSSATAEDLAGASFAGQYATVLNVRTGTALIDAIGEVWASAESESARAYRRERGVGDGDAAMAVLVQGMLDPDAAGVLFTRDPVTGDATRFVASAVLGAGEGLVSGTAPADRFAIDAATGRVVERTIATKDRRLVADSNGGLREVAVPVSRQRRAAISAGQLQDLWRLGEAIRARRGADQDIEFAVVDGVVRLLQARPMTALDAGSRDERPYRRSASAKPMRRLHEDYWRAVLAAQARTFARLPIPPIAEHELVVVDGYRYTRAAVTPESADAALAAAMDAGAGFWARRTTLLEAEIFPRVAALHAANPPVRSERAPLRRHVDHVARALEDFATVMGELHWLDPPAIEDPAGEFEAITGRPAEESEAFILGIANALTRMIDELARLSRVVATSPNLARIFDERAYDRLSAAAARSDPATARFERGFARFLRRYGRRDGSGVGSRGSFGDPTWNMDPREPLDLIRLYARADPAEHRRHARQIAARRQRAIRAMGRRLAGDPDRLARFEHWLWAVQVEARLLEDHNVAMDQEASGRLREAIWWLGRAMVRRGLIDEPDDVIHLSLAELRRIADERRPGDRRAIVAERTREFARRLGMDPPMAVDGRGRPLLDDGADAVPAPHRSDGTLPAGDHDLLVRGVPVSAGVATGRAIVSAAAGLPAHVEPGDILVAPNAGPDLTPLLPLLGGLVLDGGNPFQHSALVAREYSLPAVFATGDATTRITDGETIVVDGRAGTVRRAGS